MNGIGIDTGELNTLETALMQAVSEHEAEIGTLPDQSCPFRQSDLEALRKHGPKYTASLIAEEYGESERVRVLRCAHGLASRGLVRLHRIGGRVRYIALTPAGRAALAGVAPDPHDIAAPDPFVAAGGE